MKSQFEFWIFGFDSCPSVVTFVFVFASQILMYPEKVASVLHVFLPVGQVNSVHLLHTLLIPGGGGHFQSSCTGVCPNFLKLTHSETTHFSKFKAYTFKIQGIHSKYKVFHKIQGIHFSKYKEVSGRNQLPLAGFGLRERPIPVSHPLYASVWECPPQAFKYGKNSEI